MKRSTFLTIFLVLALVLGGCSLATTPLTLVNNDRPQAAQQEPTGTPAVSDSTQTVDESNQSSVGIADYETTLEGIYETVNPSVVNIQVGAAAFGGQNSELRSGLGSGFVWDTQGHIVTNNHVVEGAGEILVTFSDGTTVDGELVGSDPNSDLAVIKVDPEGLDLSPVIMADSNDVKVGQIAIAIGNPFGLAGTMTEGIVSARARSLPVNENPLSGGSYTIPDIIQTDASINPGNSGGVLVDIKGQVIGVTAAIRTINATANSGIGFVIPSNIVSRVVPSLIETGAYEHPRIGISGQSLSYSVNQLLDLDTNLRGVVVMDVVENSPAENAGLQGADQQGQGGDIIVGINGQPVRSFEDLTTYLFYNTEVDQDITLTILRDGQEQEVQLTLGTIDR